MFQVIHLYILRTGHFQRLILRLSDEDHINLILMKLPITLKSVLLTMAKCGGNSAELLLNMDINI